MRIPMLMHHHNGLNYFLGGVQVEQAQSSLKAAGGKPSTRETALVELICILVHR